MNLCLPLNGSFLVYSLLAETSYDLSLKKSHYSHLWLAHPLFPYQYILSGCQGVPVKGLSLAGKHEGVLPAVGILGQSSCWLGWPEGITKPSVHVCECVYCLYTCVSAHMHTWMFTLQNKAGSYLYRQSARGVLDSNSPAWAGSVQLQCIQFSASSSLCNHKVEELLYLWCLLSFHEMHTTV